VNALTRDKSRRTRAARKSLAQRKSNPLLPALLAVGGAAGLMASPAPAFELGELRLESTLGQPLKASIAYALNPHEELYNFCISLNKGPSSGLQSLTKARITVSADRIILSGTTPIEEPMLAMRVTVNCPYSAHLIRDYTLMINPPGPDQAIAETDSRTETVIGVPAPLPAATAVAREPQQQQPATRQRANERVDDGLPIPAGSEYRVQTGDTLSKIANRIVDRPVALWPAVEAIFIANEKAFVESDKNQLIAGSVLFIPTLQGAGEFTPVAIAPEDANEIDGAVTATADSYEGYSPSYEPAGVETFSDNTIAEQPPVDEVVPAVDENAAGDEAVNAVATTYEDDTAVLASGAIEPAENTSELAPIDKVTNAQPGDVFAAGEITGITAAETASDTQSAAAAPSSGSTDEAAGIPPIVTIDRSRNSTGISRSWLIWAGGAALGLIVLVLMFGRRIRALLDNRAAERAIVAPDADDDVEITQKSRALSDVDFKLDDLIPEDHEMELDGDLGESIGLSDITALDADLGMGTGLQDGTDLDVAQDFGFSQTDNPETELDLEIPAEAALEPQAGPTDIIPPHVAIDESILDSEVPPGENDDDSQYDLSMIVDATKQATGDADATTKDLQAVPVKSDAGNTEGGDQTLHQEADLKTLEQDYQEEYTQTLALNEEIERAAVELAQQMGGEDMFDVTAQMPAAADNDEFINDLEDTGISEELTINDELTANMQVHDDATVEMDIQSGSVDTKKAAR
jgi:hypothetical protein